MSVTIRQLPDLPLVKVSGEVGAFLELGDSVRRGDSYVVGASDGTMLVGIVGQGLSIGTRGASDVSIIDGVATIDGPIMWVMVSSPAMYTDGKGTAEFRADQAAMLTQERST